MPKFQKHPDDLYGYDYITEKFKNQTQKLHHLREF